MSNDMYAREGAAAAARLAGGLLAEFCETDDQRFLDGALFVIDGLIKYIETGERQPLPIAELLEELGIAGFAEIH